MSYLVPLAALIVAVAITYVFCIRPVWRGQQCAADCASDPTLEAEIGQLRTDIRVACEGLELHAEPDAPTGSRGRLAW